MMMWMMLLIKIKKKIKRNKFTLVNMGAETNVVYTWKEKSGNNE